MGKIQGRMSLVHWGIVWGGGIDVIFVTKWIPPIVVKVC
jgi:hypothetical protein